MAQVDPLPLVPATVMTGHAKPKFMRAATRFDAFQPHVDGHGMQALAMDEPVG
jgi:hypothetical protein